MILSIPYDLYIVDNFTVQHLFVHCPIKMLKKQKGTILFELNLNSQVWQFQLKHSLALKSSFPAAMLEVRGKNKQLTFLFLISAYSDGAEKGHVDLWPSAPRL